ncbi:NADP-dependent oxidoreductase domain-containing protein [Irpex lacteus]|nr:NADP-dependent oxidoreductase domain-containing protein [Irpex lacteus]
MSTIKLNDGHTIPALAIGTGTALYNKDATNAIAVAIQSGFTHLDTAQMYNNEASVGDGIIKSGHDRSQLYVTTKLGKLPAGTSVEESLKESLGKLKLEYVDLFLIHNPVDHPDLKGLWKEFEGVKEKGLTKSIGVSNFQPKHLNEILEVATVPPAVNQIEYHPYVFKASSGIIDVHKQHNIIGASYGGLTPIVRAPGKGIEPVLDKIVDRLAKEVGHPVTQGQVLQLWLRKKGFVVVTTTSKVERLQEYLLVNRLPDITSEEEEEIDTVGSKVHFRQFMKWIDGPY